MGTRDSTSPVTASPKPETTPGSESPAGSQTISQLSDSFLDRVIQLAREAQDSVYRQKLLDAINRLYEEQLSPLEKEAAYYDEAAQNMPNIAAIAPVNTATRAAELEQVRARAEAAHAAVARSVQQVSAIYTSLSQNLNPETELFSRTGPIDTATSRPISLSKLFIVGVLVALMSLPMIIIGCLIHARVRKEEEEEAAEHVGAMAV
jgi:hypothetical protein